MLTLILDTATEFLFCALIRENHQYVYASQTAHKLHAELCVSVIEDLCKQFQVAPQDISKIIVSIGPGSFTGVRIALTVAKVFGYALSIPVYPLSTLAMYASGYKDVLVTIPTRNKRYYVGHYQQNTLVSTESVMSEASLQTWLQSHPHSVLRTPPQVLTNPQAMIEAIITLQDQLQPITNIHQLQSVYLKDVA